MTQPADIPSTARHVDPETFLAREPGRSRADRASGFLMAAIMLAALALAGQRIWAVAAGPLPPGPGVAAPGFSSQTPAGAVIDLADHRGQVVLVDFWATWCPPCVASMPGLDRVHKDLGPKGFSVLGVNQEPGREERVATFMRRHQLSFPTVMDPGEISTAWGVYTFPTSFLVGRDGVIRQVYRGPPREARLREDIEAALAAPPSPSSS